MLSVTVEKEQSRKISRIYLTDLETISTFQNAQKFGSNQAPLKYFINNRFNKASNEIYRICLITDPARAGSETCSQALSCLAFQASTLGREQEAWQGAFCPESDSQSLA